MLADRLEIDFAPNDVVPRCRGYLQSYRFLEETTATYSDIPPHISLMLGEFDDPRDELFQVLGDLCAQQEPFAFDLGLQYEPKKGVWAAVGRGANEMRALREDVLEELYEDECSLRYTSPSRGPWRFHVTLYRRSLGERSSLKVKQEITRDLKMCFEGPLVGYATGASLWLGDELVESFPFLGQTEQIHSPSGDIISGRFS
ncbi:hypothetical protein FB451DRAFT_1212348 [Mycena latifolia]|nr:hypothetical protein FB451DRAFT_1212348 [Mycena latifolia]